MIGTDEAQRLVNGGVVARRHQRVLQPVPLRRVVVHVVGRHHSRAGLARQRRQLPVPHHVALQKVLLQLHVHRIPSEPLQVVVQQPQRLGRTPLQRRRRQRPVPTARQQRQPPGVLRQQTRVQTRLATVRRVGQREQPRQVAVPLPRPRQQCHSRPVRQRQFAAGDRLQPQPVGLPGEVQRPAQVGVGQRQASVPVLPCPCQQFVGM